ncbi:(Fe-S)-binding protein [Microbulbifer sp. Q7]|uniref:(Fe-S)-binding protein n=1 Tax=Microbulbifer sp. Q7 TaxID=1785091 RepID=UPI0008306B23|nr:(Fe-S)-binding protein [Microbulbifer sp. Q7]
MAEAIRFYPAKPDKVYLFGTCLVDSFSPQTGLDAITLLEREGIEVVFPQAQTCCGQPAYNSGYSDDARAVARSQIALFPEPWPIVILSGSCGGMMRKHYPALFDHAPEVVAFAERVFEFSEFLRYVVQPSLQDCGAPTTVTLHTSCAGRRELGIHEHGLALLGQLQQVNLVPHDYQEECCGFGGTFSVKHANISSAMAEDKTRNLLSAGADEFVSTDWGCMLNLNTTLEYARKPLQGRHLISFLAERTGAGSHAQPNEIAATEAEAVG